MGFIEIYLKQKYKLGVPEIVAFQPLPPPSPNAPANIQTFRDVTHIFRPLAIYESYPSFNACGLSQTPAYRALSESERQAITEFESDECQAFYGQITSQLRRDEMSAAFMSKPIFDIMDAEIPKFCRRQDTQVMVGALIKILNPTNTLVFLGTQMIHLSFNFGEH